MTTANDTSGALERLGFIGLGNMGGAIALRLLRAGYPLTVLDLDDEKMQALKKNGAAVAATPKEIAERSTIVLASLQPDDVEKVACGENGIAERTMKSWSSSISAARRRSWPSKSPTPCARVASRCSMRR